MANCRQLYETIPPHFNAEASRNVDRGRSRPTPPWTWESDHARLRADAMEQSIHLISCRTARRSFFAPTSVGCHNNCVRASDLNTMHSKDSGTH
jgi:hypothetical protein